MAKRLSARTSDRPAPQPSTVPTSPSAVTTTYRPPVGVATELEWKGADSKTGSRTSARSAAKRIQATADWIVLREHGVPSAEVFHVAYVQEPRDAQRPVTFLFNGGPGAASAFLHVGTAGPRRIRFTKEGRTLPPPATLVDNLESWLAFTDLVFVDPVGTGLSRTVTESRLEQHGIDTDDEKREKRTKELPESRKGFYKVKRDIDTLCEFVSTYLSRNNRWASPIAIAGESYGGFRVGKLIRALPERGMGLTAAMLISPAIDFMGIVGSDYDILSWTNLIPPMALAARFHGKSRGRFAKLAASELRSAAERFAETSFATHLIRGDRAPTEERRETLASLADLIGLSPEFVEQCNGRVSIERFSRELLRHEGFQCGLYDAAISGPNVFPDRESNASPDPTLGGIMAAFTAGINTMLRSELGLVTDREYLLVNEDVWKHWADDRAAGYWDRQLECADDIRYGLGLNPDVRVLIAHGSYDLVTTYSSSEQTVANLRLPRALRERIRLRSYDGGHMFYTWESSRRAIRADVADLLRGA
jgi:carboxypeptidase C (cathepsin A)